MAFDKFSYFIFKGIDSRTMNVLLQTSPTRIKPAMRVTTYNVDGRNGNIVETLGYDAYYITLQIVITDKSKIDSVVTWLNGEGKLILSCENDRYYDANVISEVDYTLLRRWDKATVQFLVQPYKHAVEPSKINYPTDLQTGDGILLCEDGSALLCEDGSQLILTKLNDINCVGNCESGTIIRITGAGNGRILKNGAYVANFYSEGTLIIDSQNCVVYDIVGNIKNRNYNGQFLTLEPGQNKIEIVGNFADVKIEVNETWI